MQNHAEQLAQELNLSLKNVQGAIDLIDAGNTIPFIARYRKEATGSMDDQVLRNLGDRLEYLRGLDKRKEEVTGSIEAQNAMTPELQAALAGAKTLAEVEDIYRPYKPKRKTRASIARARGLQPLADATLKQDANFDPQTAANDYLNEEVPDAAAALAGAQDIIAETISDDAHCRAELRRYYHAFGMVKSVKAKDEDSVYTQYYDYTEPVAKIPGHRILALDRGEREGFLKVSIAVEAERAGGIVAWMFARKKTGGASAAIVEAAALDAYSRLIHPSLENELRGELSDAAAEGAIGIARTANKVRKTPLRVILNGLGKDAAYIISRINGFTYVQTEYDIPTQTLKVVKEIPFSEGERAAVKCYGANDVMEGVAIMKKEDVQCSITGNSTNPVRFQHLVAGTYKKWAIENGKKYFSVASGGGTGRTLHPDNVAAGPASYGLTDSLGRVHGDAQFAGSSSVPAHVEMMGLIGMGNNPMVGATVACAVAAAQANA